MKNITGIYLDRLKEKVSSKISKEITDDKIDKIVNENFIEAHIEDPRSKKFQQYYFKTIKNDDYFLNNKFFSEFKTQYALQGIDNKFLKSLEKDKQLILNEIKEEDLAGLYFGKFREAKIKHGNGSVYKDLGSFFAKLVHTFLPEKYCALDNPIKDHFGLKKESFFISFLVISVAYRDWAINNKELISNIRRRFLEADTEKFFDHDKITDLKLLDLIFWSKANPPKQKK